MANTLCQPVSIWAHACCYLVSTPCLCTFVLKEHKRCLNLNYPVSVCSNFQSVLQNYIQQKNLELRRAFTGMKKHVVPTLMEDGHFSERLCLSRAEQRGGHYPLRGPITEVTSAPFFGLFMQCGSSKVLGRKLKILRAQVELGTETALEGKKTAGSFQWMALKKRIYIPSPSIPMIKR